MHNISLNGSLRMMYHLHNEDDVSPLAHYIGSMILQTVAVRWGASESERKMLAPSSAATAESLIVASNSDE